METTHEDYLDTYKRRVKRARKRFELLWEGAVQRDGKDGARHDKEIGDLRDLLLLARRQLTELDTDDELAFARDREGLARALDELEGVLHKAEQRVASSA